MTLAYHSFRGSSANILWNAFSERRLAAASHARSQKLSLALARKGVGRFSDGFAARTRPTTIVVEPKFAAQLPRLSNGL